MNPSPAFDRTASVPERQRLGRAAAADLQKATAAALRAAYGAFLQQLPAVLGEYAARAPNPPERQMLEKLARSVGANAPRWLEAFVDHVDAHLIGGVAPVRSEGASGTEDSVVLAQMELRAEARYQKLVTELDARVNRIRLMLYVPIYTRALAPAALFQALQHTADSVGWPQPRRGLLFEIFDARFVPALDGLYRALIEELKRLGTAAEKATADAGGPAAVRVPPPKPAASGVGIAPPTDARQVDAETLAMLQELAVKSDGDGYTDSLLAADLLALADHRPLPGLAQDDQWIPLQRIALAGHFLNEAIADPMIPDELRPQQEAVRFPLVKSALADETLFTSSSHPLSGLIHELLLKAETSRVTGNAETRHMAELLQQVLTQFSLAPDFVREAMQTSKPIGRTQVERFHALQRQQAHQRRDFVIAEAKRVVMRHLQDASFGRDIPAPALTFLNRAWGPLLTKRLLQHGAASAAWKAAMSLMDQLLEQLESRLPGEPPLPEWRRLLQAMGQALVQEGLSEERVKPLLAELDVARQAPSTGLGFGPLA